MGAAKLPVMAAAKRPGRRWSGPVLAVVLVAVAACGGGSTIVPPPTATERAETVPILQRAAEAQGICYGWRLMDGYRYGSDKVVSVGSNLGDGVPVTDNPSCPRWVEVAANVHYTSSSSEAEDSSNIQVSSSDEDVRVYTIIAGLARLGIDDKAFIDEPGWAICRAATMLPLLTAETGDAEPAPVATAPPTAPPAALAEPGSDFWRDRWSNVIVATCLFLVTALLLTVGFVKRRNRARS